MRIYTYKGKWHLYPLCYKTEKVVEEIPLEIIGGEDRPILAGSAELCTIFSERICRKCLETRSRFLTARKMQKMRDEGKTLQQIADDFNVSRQRVWQYLEG